MKTTIKVSGLLTCVGLVGSLATTASAADRGFQFNNLNISPYVNIQYRYDSNVDSAHRGEFDDSILTVTPGVDLKYKGNNWGLDGHAFYGYDNYIKYDELDTHRWGERLKLWYDGERWKLVLGESFIYSKESDSIIDGGRGYWRERDQLQFTGAFSYDLSEASRMTVDAAYSQLDYHNDSKRYAPLYGWHEWSAGLEFARRLTQKTNWVLAGGVQGYESDNATRNGLKNESYAYDIQGGISSRATERITYRLLAGVSWFDYATDDINTGWIYTANVNWLLSKKWAASFTGSSYYQPSESKANQANKIYSLSGGLTYRPYKRVTTTFNLAWRREEEEYKTYQYDQHIDTLAARVRASYQFARYASVFVGAEYSERFSDNSNCEYDRYILSTGLKLFY